MRSTGQFAPFPSHANHGQIGCGSCALHHRCLPGGLDRTGTELLSGIITRRRMVRGEHLFRLGDAFHHLYAIRFGHFKIFHDDLTGQRQILGFPMASEVLGLDAICPGHHVSGGVALEDSEVCAIPFLRLERLSEDLPGLQRQFYRILGRQITRDQSAMLVMGKMRAEQKIAMFVLNLSARYAASGYSPLSFQLRMSRQEIGNFLGLTVESISRLMLRLRQKGMIRTNHRELTITDRTGLTALATGRVIAEPLANRVQITRPASADRLRRPVD